MSVLYVINVLHVLILVLFVMPGMTERERLVMKKLKEVVDRQRDEIRAKDRELTLKNEDIEAVKSHVLAEQILLLVAVNAQTLSQGSKMKRCH